MINIKNIFPKNENEKNLVEFIGRYQYLHIKDIKYFFNDTYYPKRIRKMIQNGIIRKYTKYYVLSENGYNYMKMINKPASPLIYQPKYSDRLKYLSHLAALYNQEKYITFTPSFEVKDKKVFTESSRKYIGVLDIFRTKYLIYHISSEHTNKYINSIIYDLQKETTYKNIIILVNDINRIDLNKFALGFNSLIICEDNDIELEKLKYIQQINHSKIISDNYNNNKLHISEYRFCNYTDNINKYVSIFYFVDTEKIYRINTFIKNNPNKQADIICSKEIISMLR